MKVLRIFYGLLLISSHTIAGNNPIGWRLNQEFPNPVYSGINYTVTYTLTNNLPLTLVRPLNIQKQASSLSEFSYIDNCSGQKLASKASCTVIINLSPLAVGDKSVQIFIAGYDDNVVPLPMLLTNAQSSIVAGVSGKVTQAISGQMQTGRTSNYIFTFTNYGAVEAGDVHVAVSQTTGSVNITSNTCMPGGLPGTIAPNQGFCIVSGSFTPATSSPSAQDVTATLTFTGATGSPQRVSTFTTVNAPDADIVASIVPPNSLPPLMQTSTGPYTIEFLFSNTTSGSVNISGPGIVTCEDSNHVDCSAQLSSTVSQCTAPSLNLGQNCSITTHFTAPASADSPPLSYTVSASLPFTGTGSPASTSTSGSVVATLPTERTIKLYNQCNFEVWFSLNGAAVSGYAPPSCPAGTSGAGGKCYWNNYPFEATGVFGLAQNASYYVTIPAYNLGGTQWSGNISASTGCSGENCNQASCDNHGGNTSCAVGQGFSQPATQAEITMLVNSADNYDVEVINGFHIPVSMTPYYYLSSTTPADDIPATGDNYVCGTPGNLSAANGFGACNWETVGSSVTLPSPTSYYYWIGGGSGNACGSCLTGEICGLNSLFENKCGNFLGYWTPNELCTQGSLPSTIRNALQCDVSTGFNLSPPDKFNNTYTSLMACPVATGYSGPTYNTCYATTYSSGSNTTQCCGCVDWWQPSQTKGGVTILANNTATVCPAGQTDPVWTNNIQPGIQWMKQACPSLYVYPFDDASSKFTCSNNLANSTNTTSYVITFCPNNGTVNTGLPAGVNEGRG